MQQQTLEHVGMPAQMYAAQSPGLVEMGMGTLEAFPTLPQPRWVLGSHLDAVLFHVTPGSKTAARLQLMHWTGMRPSQMGRLTRADFHLDELRAPA